MTISDEQLRFAVDYVRNAHRRLADTERPPDVDMMQCLIVVAHAALQHPEPASVTEDIVNDPANMANVREVLTEVFRQEREAAELN